MREAVADGDAVLYAIVDDRVEVGVSEYVRELEVLVNERERVLLAEI